VSNPASAAESSVVPDLPWLRDHVPMRDVYAALGGVLSSNSHAHCWRSENHKAGDRTASFAFNPRNNHGHCFHCDDREYSNIDLVSKIRGCETYQAVRWIADHFSVRYLPKGRHLNPRQTFQPFYRAGLRDDPMYWLVKAGVFAQLATAAVRVLATLLTFMEDRKECRIAYRTIRRYSGLRTNASVHKALRELADRHIISVEKVARDKQFPIERCIGHYILTLDDPQLEAWVKETMELQQRDIELEKRFREQQRRERRQRYRQHVPAKSNLAVQEVN
jgi:hypothetical protein